MVVCGGGAADAEDRCNIVPATIVPVEAKPACKKCRRSISGIASACSLGWYSPAIFSFSWKPSRRRHCMWHQPRRISLVQHLRDLSLSVVDGKTVRQTGHRVVVSQRHFVWLEATVGGGWRAASAQGFHIALRHRLKPAHDA